MGREAQPIHPAEVELYAFLDGELPSEDRSRLEQHLAACPACARRLARASHLFTQIDSLPEQAVGRDLARPVVRSLRGDGQRLPVLGLLGLQSLATVGLIWAAGERTARLLTPLAQLDLAGPMVAGWTSLVGTVLAAPPWTTGLSLDPSAWLRNVRPMLPDLGIPATWALWGVLALGAWLVVNTLVWRAERERPSDGK